MAQVKRALVVLNNVPPPRPTTNPYSIMLIDAIRAEPDAILLDFSWRRALFHRYDVFHAHWPESLMGGRRPMRAVRALLFGLLVSRVWLTRVAIVRTQHNVGQPDGLSRIERALLTAFERRTTLFIVLNRHTPLPYDRPSVLIPHGHYRDWYGGYPTHQSIPSRFAYYGLIRRYKGVEQLVTAFREMVVRSPDSTLVIGGRPSSEELALNLTELAGDERRITLRFGFLPPPDLVALATSAELVVLPYRSMHNSGAILTALSLDRPVLAPSNPVTADLGEEVGSGWVFTYDGDLDASELSKALAEVRDESRAPRPNLDARGWEGTGRAHVDAFLRARTISRGGSR